MVFVLFQTYLSSWQKAGGWKSRVYFLSVRLRIYHWLQPFKLIVFKNVNGESLFQDAVLVLCWRKGTVAVLAVLVGSSCTGFTTFMTQKKYSKELLIHHWLPNRTWALGSLWRKEINCNSCIWFPTYQFICIWPCLKTIPLVNYMTEWIFNIFVEFIMLFC